MTDAENSPVDGAQQEVAVIPGLFTLSGAAALGTFSIDVAKAAAPWLMPQQTFYIDVIDSALSDGYHLITLAFSNTGRHGVYIEELFVAKPKNEPILVGDYVKNMMKGPGFNDGLLGKPEKKFPLHIEPGFDSRIVIAVPQKSRLGLRKGPFNYVGICADDVERPKTKGAERNKGAHSLVARPPRDVSRQREKMGMSPIVPCFELAILSWRHRQSLHTALRFTTAATP